MRPDALADTGFILALLDRDDAWHQRCVDAFPALRLPLTTTSAVLTELFHLLGDHPRSSLAAWTFLRSGAITLAPISDPDLPDLNRLMRKYADRPMDYADATLVHVATRESITTVCTVDNDDFETYRIGGRRRFRVIPGREGSTSEAERTRV